LKQTKRFANIGAVRNFFQVGSDPTTYHRRSNLSSGKSGGANYTFAWRI